MTLRFSLEEKLAVLLIGFAIVGAIVGIAGTNLIITSSAYVWTGWILALYGAITLFGALGGGLALAKEVLAENGSHSFSPRIKLLDGVTRISQA
jgi:hypothetical protein